MTGPVAPDRTGAPGDDDDLRRLGYAPTLRRGLRSADSIALGIATISPVVGLFAVTQVGARVAGPAWLWVLPVALAGQCLLLAVYAELVTVFPVAGGPYQWVARLTRPRLGWFAGWVMLCSYVAANTTIAYLTAPWALALLDVEQTPLRVVGTAALVTLLTASVNLLGIGAVRRVLVLGMGAEVVASLVAGVLLLLAFRQHGPDLLLETLDAPARVGLGGVGAGLAALAVAGWVFIGFDACVQAAEETRGPGRHVPRALWTSLLGVATLVLLVAVAVVLAHPSPASLAAGTDPDPVGTAVRAAFGGWVEEPFTAVVLVAFVTCGTAAHGATARVVFSMARDGAVPGASTLSRVGARQVPGTAVVVVAVLSTVGLLLGLEGEVIGPVIAFGTVSAYVFFTLVAGAALVARLRGRLRARPWDFLVNGAALAWLAFETMNIAWPRRALTPDGGWQVWAPTAVLVGVLLSGALLARRYGGGAAPRR